jgi:phosphatidylglycerophosphate synthase
MLTRFAHVPRALLAITLGRLFFVPIIIVSFDAVPAVTTAALAIFIAADLYDGVLARRLEADDTARRTLDTIVDRLSIWPVYIAITAWGYLAVPLLAVFAVRELFAAYWCQRVLRERDVVLRADWMYRTLNLMLAGWVILAPFESAAQRNALFGVVLLFSAVVAFDVMRSLRSVLTMPPGIRSVVIPAGELRARRAHRPVAAAQPAPGALRSA